MLIISSRRAESGRFRSLCPLSNDLDLALDAILGRTSVRFCFLLAIRARASNWSPSADCPLGSRQPTAMDKSGRLSVQIRTTNSGSVAAVSHHRPGTAASMCGEPTSCQSAPGPEAAAIVCSTPATGIGPITDCPLLAVLAQVPPSRLAPPNSLRAGANSHACRARSRGTSLKITSLRDDGHRIGRSDTARPRYLRSDHLGHDI